MNGVAETAMVVNAVSVAMAVKETGRSRQARPKPQFSSLIRLQPPNCKGLVLLNL